MIAFLRVRRFFTIFARRVGWHQDFFMLLLAISGVVIVVWNGRNRGHGSWMLETLNVSIALHLASR